MSYDKSHTDDWAREAMIKLRESLELDAIVYRLNEIETRLSQLEQKDKFKK